MGKAGSQISAQTVTQQSASLLFDNQDADKLFVNACTAGSIFPFECVASLNTPLSLFWHPIVYSTGGKHVSHLYVASVIGWWVNQLIARNSGWLTQAFF